jgi:hypothetical protein
LNINFSPLSLYLKFKKKQVKIYEDGGPQIIFVVSDTTTKVLWIHRRARSPKPANIYDDDGWLTQNTYTKTKNPTKIKISQMVLALTHTHMCVVCAYLRYPRLFAVWTFKRA